MFWRTLSLAETKNSFSYFNKKNLILNGYGVLSLICNNLPVAKIGSGMWKRKRLNFCRSESTLKKEAGSGSKLGSD